MIYTQDNYYSIEEIESFNYNEFNRFLKLLSTEQLQELKERLNSKVKRNRIEKELWK